MSELFQSDDAAAWEQAAESYTDVLRRYGGQDLETKDTFWTVTLPASLQRSGTMNKGELVKLMDWKLTRGKWRPLMGHIKGLDAASVEQAATVVPEFTQPVVLVRPVIT